MYEVNRARVGDGHISPSRRWATTTTSAMDEVSKAMAGENIGREARVADLRNRKIANTQTSIRFGNDAVNYVSDTQENQRRSLNGVNPADRAKQTANIKKMKADLTVTNFRLGDEAPLYETVNREAMAAAKTFAYSQKHEGNNVKEMIKKSSLHFGNEPVRYESCAHEAMEYRGTKANFAQLKDEVGKMSANLRKHNFSFGEEKTLYQSDYTRGYGSVPKEAYIKSTDKKEKMKAIIDDSRSCHFSLGNDGVEYQSNTHTALKQVLGREQSDVVESLERSKQMKTALQKTSFIVGDDDDYY